MVGTAVLALLASVLLSGCELREGAQTEYGEYSLDSKEKITELSREFIGHDVRQF
jgi:hypothetical protein